MEGEEHGGTSEHEVLTGVLEQREGEPSDALMEPHRVVARGEQVGDTQQLGGVVGVAQPPEQVAPPLSRPTYAGNSGTDQLLSFRI